MKQNSFLSCYCSSQIVTSLAGYLDVFQIKYDMPWDYGILKITAMDDESDYMCYVVQGMESVLTLLCIPEGNLLIYDRVVE